VGQPYRAIEVLGATQPVSSARPVPPPNQRLEVLEESSGSGFYVLDLVARRVLPLLTDDRATLSLSPDGKRIWAFEQQGTRISAIDLATLNPVPLTTDVAIQAVYDVQRLDGGRAAIAIHGDGTLGATVFDALVPDTVTSRRVPALLL